MGNNHGRPIIDKVCKQINDFVNDPSNQNLTFDQMILAIQVVVKTAESTYGTSQIHRSVWRVNRTDQVLHATWTDPHATLIVIVDWAAAKKGGCQLGFPPEELEGGSIPLFSGHFREKFDESINIDGTLTFLPSSSRKTKYIKSENKEKNRSEHSSGSQVNGGCRHKCHRHTHKNHHHH